MTALNVMHQRPDAPPLRAWWAELHAQQALVAVVSGHGLPKGRLIATEIQAGEHMHMDREGVRHESSVDAHGSTTRLEPTWV
jgi:hypothetical protein